MEERARGDLHLNLFVKAGDRNAVQRLYRTLCLTMDGAESREVMLSDQYLRGFVHSSCVQRGCNLPAMPLVEGKRRAPVGDFVNIAPADTIKARVPVIRHDIAGQHRHRMRP